jgi:hypothetical protein
MVLTWRLLYPSTGQIQEKVFLELFSVPRFLPIQNTLERIVVISKIADWADVLPFYGQSPV